MICDVGCWFDMLCDMFVWCIWEDVVCVIGVNLEIIFVWQFVVELCVGFVVVLLQEMKCLVVCMCWINFVLVGDWIFIGLFVMIEGVICFGQLVVDVFQM